MSASAISVTGPEPCARAPHGTKGAASPAATPASTVRRLGLKGRCGPPIRLGRLSGVLVSSSSSSEGSNRPRRRSSQGAERRFAHVEMDGEQVRSRRHEQAREVAPVEAQIGDRTAHLDRAGQRAGGALPSHSTSSAALGSRSAGKSGGGGRRAPGTRSPPSAGSDVKGSVGSDTMRSVADTLGAPHRVRHLLELHDQHAARLVAHRARAVVANGVVARRTRSEHIEISNGNVD